MFTVPFDEKWKLIIVEVDRTTGSSVTTTGIVVIPHNDTSLTLPLVIQTAGATLDAQKDVDFADFELGGEDALYLVVTNQEASSVFTYEVLIERRISGRYRLISNEFY